MFLLKLENIKGNNFEFKNIVSDSLVSFFNKNVLSLTLHSLIIMYNTYLKLFMKNGLTNNMKLISVKKYKKHKQLNEFYYDLMINKNKHLIYRNPNDISFFDYG